MGRTLPGPMIRDQMAITALAQTFKIAVMAIEIQALFQDTPT